MFLLFSNRGTESDAAIAAAFGAGLDKVGDDVMFDQTDQGGFEIDFLEGDNAATNEPEDNTCYSPGCKKRADWPDDIKNNPYCVMSADGASFLCLACFQKGKNNGISLACHKYAPGVWV